MIPIPIFEIMPANKLQSTIESGGFKLGSVNATANCSHFTSEEAWTALTRHASGDWGDIPAGEKEKNAASVKSGKGALISAFKHSDGTMLCLITLLSFNMTLFCTVPDMVKILESKAEDTGAMPAITGAPTKGLLN